jgi:hypothetical protein
MFNKTFYRFLLGFFVVVVATLAFTILIGAGQNN